MPTSWLSATPLRALERAAFGPALRHHGPALLRLKLTVAGLVPALRRLQAQGLTPGAPSEPSSETQASPLSGRRLRLRYEGGVARVLLTSAVAPESADTPRRAQPSRRAVDSPVGRPGAVAHSIPLRELVRAARALGGAASPEQLRAKLTRLTQKRVEQVISGRSQPSRTEAIMPLAELVQATAALAGAPAARALQSRISQATRRSSTGAPSPLRIPLLPPSRAGHSRGALSPTTRLWATPASGGDVLIRWAKRGAPPPMEMRSNTPPPQWIEDGPEQPRAPRTERVATPSHPTRRAPHGGPTRRLHRDATATTWPRPNPGPPMAMLPTGGDEAVLVARNPKAEKIVRPGAPPAPPRAPQAPGPSAAPSPAPAVGRATPPGRTTGPGHPGGASAPPPSWSSPDRKQRAQRAREEEAQAEEEASEASDEQVTEAAWQRRDRRAGKRRAYALARRAAPKDPAMEALPSLDEREMLTVLRALSEHSPAAAELLADVARRVDSLRHLSKLRQMR